MANPVQHALIGAPDSPIERQRLRIHWADIFICAWCMPNGILGTHGICQRCLIVQLLAIGA